MKNWWRIPQLICAIMVMGCIVSPLWDALASSYQTTNVYLTPIGGIAVKMANYSGTTTIYGMAVSAPVGTGTAYSSGFTAGAEYDTIGFCYESGVTAGGQAWVVVAGIADVLMSNNTVATIGDIVVYGGTPRMSVGIPNPGLGLPGTDQHFTERGHFIGTNTAGTNQVARAAIHFN